MYKVNLPYGLIDEYIVQYDLVVLCNVLMYQPLYSKVTNETFSGKCLVDGHGYGRWQWASNVFQNKLMAYI